MIMEAAVPVGTRAEVAIPGRASDVTVNGTPAQAGKLLLESGSYRIEWTK